MNLKKIVIIFLVLIILCADKLMANPSDSITINIKNKALKEFLLEIEHQTNYTFVYSNSEIDVNKKIKYKAKNIELAKLLNDVLGKHEIEFEFIGKQIILKKQDKKHITKSPIEICGKVINKSDNLALPYVNVYIKETLKGTTTNIDGSFILTITNNKNTLVFSSIGYKTHEIKILDEINFQVLLEKEKHEIDEVIVIGYGNESKKILSSSVSDLKAESINRTISSNISESLKGKLTGVFINQNSGTPGAEATFRIRGVSSISAGSDPLYVIDGVPAITMNLSQISFSGQGVNTIYNINPTDIESVSILKDASAAAIYGARGSNGVILITTKRGSSNKSIIRFNATNGLQKVTNAYTMLNSEEFMRYKNEAAINDGRLPIYTNNDIINNTIDTDWQKELYRIAPIKDYNLALSYGSEKTKYYFTAGFYDQSGIALGTDYKRISSRLNLDHKFSQKLDIGIGLAITKSTNNRKEGDQSLNGPIPNAIELAPIYPVYNQDGTYNDDGPLANSISIANQHINVAYNWNNFANVFANYKINKNLSYKFKLGVDYVNFREHTFDPPTTRQGAKYQGYGEEATSEVIKTLTSNTIKYSLNYAKVHRVDALLGHEINKEQMSFTYMRGEQFPSDKLDYLVSSAEKVSADANFRESIINSFFGRLKYNLNNKYLATFNARYDGSSKFSNKNKFGFFPSGDIAWRISEESFFKYDFINDFKIRASYGITGNDGISDFLYLSRYGTAEYAGSTVIYPSNISNPGLKWESTKQFNIGIDLSLMNDRVILNFDYYKKKTKDLLLEKPIPLSSGFPEIISNIGKLENEGFEFTLKTVNSNTAVFWVSQLNISINKNKVTQLYNDQAIENIGRGHQRIEVGEAIGIFYGYHSLGVDPSTGDLVFEDINFDGKIDINDKKKIGSPHAKFQGGLSNNLSYKNFNLNFFFQFSYGNDIFNGTRRYIEAMKGNDNQTIATLRRWQKPGDITDIPRATCLDPNDNNRVSSRFIEDGSYLKLKNVKFSYNVSEKVLKKLHIQSLSIFALAQNLFTLTKFSGMDPEVNYAGSTTVTSGVEFFTYPSAKIFSLGLSVEF